MTLSEAVRDVLSTCPYLPETIAIDSLGTQPAAFALIQDPSPALLKRYLSGETVRRADFTLLSRSPTLTDSDRAQNTLRYEHLTRFLEAQTQVRALPALTDGRVALSLLSVGNAYRKQDDPPMDHALYAIELALIYTQRTR